MKTVWRHRGLLYSGAAGVVLGALGMVWMNSSSSGHVVARWSQPESVQYGSFEPYTLYVVEVGTTRTLFARRPAHEIRVVRGSDSDGYGHRIDLGFDFWNADVDGYIRGSKVIWTEDGVTLEMPSAHRIFIPKRAFIGGR
jgi:hypothetical protein